MTKGKVLIPREVRARLGITEGVAVELEEEDGRVTIIPTTRNTRSEYKPFNFSEGER